MYLFVGVIFSFAFVGPVLGSFVLLSVPPLLCQCQFAIINWPFLRPLFHFLHFPPPPFFHFHFRFCPFHCAKSHQKATKKKKGKWMRVKWGSELKECDSNKESKNEASWLRGDGRTHRTIIRMDLDWIFGFRWDNDDGLFTLWGGGK